MSNQSQTSRPSDFPPRYGGALTFPGDVPSRYRFEPAKNRWTPNPFIRPHAQKSTEGVVAIAQENDWDTGQKRVLMVTASGWENSAALRAVEADEAVEMGITVRSPSEADKLNLIILTAERLQLLSVLVHMERPPSSVRARGGMVWSELLSTISNSESLTVVHLVFATPRENIAESTDVIIQGIYDMLVESTGLRELILDFTGLPLSRNNKDLLAKAIGMSKLRLCEIAVDDVPSFAELERMWFENMFNNWLLADFVIGAGESIYHFSSDNPTSAVRPRPLLNNIGHRPHFNLDVAWNFTPFSRASELANETILADVARYLATTHSVYQLILRDMPLRHIQTLMQAIAQINSPKFELNTLRILNPARPPGRGFADAVLERLPSNFKTLIVHPPRNVPVSNYVPLTYTGRPFTVTNTDSHFACEIGVPPTADELISTATTSACMPVDPTVDEADQHLARLFALKARWDTAAAKDAMTPAQHAAWRKLFEKNVDLFLTAVTALPESTG